VGKLIPHKGQNSTIKRAALKVGRLADRHAELERLGADPSEFEALAAEALALRCQLERLDDRPLSAAQRSAWVSTPIRRKIPFTDPAVYHHTGSVNSRVFLSGVLDKIESRE